MNLTLLPASLPMWARIAVPLAILVLPGGSLILVLWLAFDRMRRRAHLQPAMLAPAPVPSEQRGYGNV